jgi:intracellular multiplication protein IcmP
MYSLFDQAHLYSGVLQSALFLWLKPKDRRLWYILNNVGRKVAWPEITGVFAHWQFEYTLMQTFDKELIDVSYSPEKPVTALEEPHVDAGVEGFQVALDLTDLPRDYLKRKK